MLLFLKYQCNNVKNKQKSKTHTYLSSIEQSCIFPNITLNMFFQSPAEVHEVFLCKTNARSENHSEALEIARTKKHLKIYHPPVSNF